MNGKEVTPEMRNEARKRRRKGEKLWSIADDLGICASTVLRHTEDIKRHASKKIDDAILDDMIAMREEGKTFREIAGKYKVAHSTIRERIAKRSKR